MPSNFTFGAGSARKLRGVNEALVTIAHEALAISRVDFSITSGVRTPKQQKALVEAGKSWTMDSRHLTGHAIDVCGWVDGATSYHSDHLFAIAEAMCSAAVAVGYPVRWGGAWHIGDIRDVKIDMADLNAEYDRLRKSQGRVPSHDLPHFELPA